MKAKIGELFKLFQEVNNRCTNLLIGAQGGANYDQLLVITNILQEVLENCETEVELSSIADCVLIPYLQNVMFDAIIKRP